MPGENDVRHVVARAPMQTIRPRDLKDLYSAPRVQVHRLVERGVLHRISHGVYCLVPLGEDPRTWRPAPETAAAAIAAATWPQQDSVLMGLSAARMHGALPRALAEAWIAAPAQHAPIDLTDGSRVNFAYRDTVALDAEPAHTELGKALVTTPSQTALDLARDPAVVDDADTRSVIQLLLDMEPFERAEHIASRQGRTGGALRRLRALVS